MSDKSMLWDQFVDSLALAVRKTNEYEKKMHKHHAGGTYCPFSDTPDGFALQQDVVNAKASAREALDSYLKPHEE